MVRFPDRPGAPPLASVRVVHDEAEYCAAFDEQATAAAWTVVIAPECGGVLLERAEMRACLRRTTPLARSRDRETTSDKQATAEHLARAGVAVPRGAGGAISIHFRQT